MVVNTMNYCTTLSFLKSCVHLSPALFVSRLGRGLAHWRPWSGGGTVDTTSGRCCGDRDIQEEESRIVKFSVGEGNVSVMI